MAIFTVTNVNDSGAGSLRQAISDANANPSVDGIEFDQSLRGQTIRLTSGALSIESDLVIDGLGADEVTISAEKKSRVFVVDASEGFIPQVHINDLTIAQGSPPGFADGGGVLNSGGDLTLTRVVVRDSVGGSRGTGIANRGVLKLIESVVTENQNDTRAGVGGAAGIANFTGAELEIERSTISNNISAKTGSGILNNGKLRISNSTISGNVIETAPSGFGGAGILNGDKGTATISSSTITDNQVIYKSGSNALYEGAGIRNNNRRVPITISNTIVANNEWSDPRLGNRRSDVFGPVKSDGYNFISSGRGSAGFGRLDRVGSSSAPLDPALGALQDNGGPTPTSAPIFGSPVIDKGDPFTPGGFDQRGAGYPRRLDGGGSGRRAADIGAFEFNGSSQPNPFNIFNGTPDDDRYQGTTGDDLIRGGGGDDRLNGKAGNDVMEGGDGRDRLEGEEGNDWLLGGYGDDEISGGPGSDVLIGGRGRDTLIGDDGNDRFIWNHSDGSDTIDGGAGRDTLEVNGAKGARNVFRVGGDRTQISFERSNLDPFTIEAQSVERLEVNGGKASDSFILSDLSASSLERVSFTGGQGNDFLNAASANVSITAEGGERRDFFIGSQENDSLFGEADNDVILGQGGNDFLTGGSGDDRILGGEGNDFIAGDAGNDQLFGGAGNDRFVFYGNVNLVDGLEAFDRDRIRDFTKGEDTIELLFFDGLTDFTDLDTNFSGVLDAGDDRVTRLGTGAIRIELGDLFGDARGDHTITVIGGSNLEASDFRGL